MNPLVILGSLAAGVFAIAKKKPEPAPVPPPAAVQKATGLARSAIARGMAPEDAAAWAADKVAEQGGGFWDDEKSRRSAGTVQF